MLSKVFAIFALVSLTAAASRDSLLISAFNVQNFGLRKMGLDRYPRRDQEQVVARLVQIIQRYDLVIIQEIVDITEMAFPQLVQLVNANDTRYSYDYFMSPRYGGYRMEQYGYIFRTERVYPVEHLCLNLSHTFERRSDIVQFKCLLPGCQPNIFNTIVLHAKPDATSERKTVREISDLVRVYDYVVKKSCGLEDAVSLGDLNADCDYVKAADWPNIALRTDNRFTWLIGDNADTAVSKRGCAYDRIITAGMMPRDPRLASVYNFTAVLRLTDQQAKAVSDHFPVELRVGLSTEKHDREN